MEPDLPIFIVSLLVMNHRWLINDVVTMRIRAEDDLEASRSAEAMAKSMLQALRLHGDNYTKHEHLSIDVVSVLEIRGGVS